MLIKQVAGVGAETWMDKIRKEKDEEKSEERGADTSLNQLAHMHVAIIMFCTDQGPDQKGADKQISFELKGYNFILYVRQWCLEHIGHLGVAAQ